MKQQFERYTPDDLAVWSTLFERQIKNLQNKASREYLEALESMSLVLNPDELPHFERINDWFSTRTGWQIACVPGLIEVDAFFDLLAAKKFPSSTWLRSKDKLDYLEEPDMFHDIFGHIPLLAHPGYSQFVHAFGILGNTHRDHPEILLQLQRLYWFTIEFGLLSEAGSLRIFGAGIISSFHEAQSSLALSGTIAHLPFNLEQILQTHFCTSEVQQHYFVLDNMLQLEQSIHMLSKKYAHELESHRTATQNDRAFQ